MAKKRETKKTDVVLTSAESTERKEVVASIGGAITQLRQSWNKAVAPIRKALATPEFREKLSLIGQRIIELQEANKRAKKIIEMARSEECGAAYFCSLEPVDRLTVIMIISSLDEQAKEKFSKQFDTEFKRKMSEAQSKIAQRPRNRKPAVGAGRDFVQAVKRVSGKRQPHTAWDWLKTDASFGGFDVVSVDSGSVLYTHNNGTKHTLKRPTFNKYWA